MQTLGSPLFSYVSFVYAVSSVHRFLGLGACQHKNLELVDFHAVFTINTAIGCSGLKQVKLESIHRKLCRDCARLQ